MNVQYRVLTRDDLEQAAYLEAVAFYNQATPERVEQMRRFFPPEWTLGAFVEGRLVADVRTIPMARRINGGAMAFGAVGPVACLSGYRRQGHVGKLLRMSLERMRDQAQALSGLYTPHDALYQRFGWERAEGKKRYQFRPKDVTLRVKAGGGRLEQVAPEDWQRLDAVYRRYAEQRNGPFHRPSVWWREAVLRHYDGDGGRRDREAFAWQDASGDDAGYVVYVSQPMAPEGRWQPQEIWVRDFVALAGDAYLGLWEHILTHDIARKVTAEAPLDDPFRELARDPWQIETTVAEGAMLRVVDVDRALATRPFAGDSEVCFTMRVRDDAAPWNDGVWRVEAAAGRLQAQRKDGEPDVELSANTLAPLFSGYMRPEVAAGAGLLSVNRAQAVAEMATAFAVLYPPYCNDWY